MIDRSCISLSSKCQLSCTYCHFDTRIDKNGVEQISDKDALKVIYNFHQYASANQTGVKIGLVGSGEPLLRLDLIKEIVYTAERIDPDGRLNFYTISNGMFFTENTCEFFFEHRERIKLCFSLDGPQKIHDLCRRTANGKGSYSTVVKSIQLYRETFGEAPSINATVHRETLRNAESVLNFFEENFKEVTFSKLVDVESPHLRIGKEDFQNFMELARTRNLALRQFNSRKYDCTMYGRLCGVGRTNIYFDNGKVYPCGRFVGNRKYELGTVRDSIDVIEKNMVERITPCTDGQCYYDTLNLQ